MTEEKKVKCHLFGQTFNSVEDRDKHNKEVHPRAWKLSHLAHGDTGSETK